jgi:large subunit ribosomal protein L22
MEAKAILRGVRHSPRKTRLVTNLVVGKQVDEALDMLKYVDKKAAHFVSKAIKSALHNALHNNNMNQERLYIASAVANQGPRLKRINPRARGQADRISKPSTHIEVVVEER